MTKGLHNRVILLGCLLATSLSATDYTWLNTPASGTWNTTDANWSGSGSVWVNDLTNNRAFFGASTQKAITLGSLQAKEVSVTADGYSFSGGTLEVMDTFKVNAGCRATLNGTVKYKETGTARVYCVKGGTLEVEGGLLQWDRTNTDSYASMSGTLIVSGGEVDFTKARELLNGDGGAGFITVKGNGLLSVPTFRIANSSDPQNTVNLQTGGVLRAAQVWCPNNATFNFDGGTLVATRGDFGSNYAWTDREWFFGSTSWVGRAYAKIKAGGAVIDVGGNSVTVAASLQNDALLDGGLAIQGTTGTLKLRADNTFNGGTRLRSGTLNITNDLNLGALPVSASTNLLFLAPATLQAGGNFAMNSNRVISVSNNVAATFDTQAYTQQVSRIVLAEGATFVKKGTGLLALARDQGDSAWETFKPAADMGTVCFTAGSNSSAVIANASLVATNSGLMIGGGTFNLTSTTFDSANTILNLGTGSGAALIVTNGLCDLTRPAVVYNPLKGSTTIEGSGVLEAKDFRPSNDTTTNNRLNLNGGTLSVNVLTANMNLNRRGEVNFNGGTLKAKIDSTSFLGTIPWRCSDGNGGVYCMIREGGAIIDSNGKNVRCLQPLLSGASNDGGLTKKGLGTLTLAPTNACTYVGKTIVEAGTLLLACTNGSTLASQTVVKMYEGAYLNVNNTTQTVAGVEGRGTIQNNAGLTINGIVQAGDTNGEGTLTLQQSCAVSGTLRTRLNAGGTTCGRLHVGGDLNLAGLHLEVENLGALDKNRAYVIASCDGTLTGAFLSKPALPAAWSVRVSGNQVSLRYISGTVIQFF